MPRTTHIQIRKKFEGYTFEDILPSFSRFQPRHSRSRDEAWLQRDHQLTGLAHEFLQRKLWRRFEKRLEQVMKISKQYWLSVIMMWTKLRQNLSTVRDSVIRLLLGYRWYLFWQYTWYWTEHDSIEMLLWDMKMKICHGNDVLLLPACASVFTASGSGQWVGKFLVRTSPEFYLLV